MTAARFLKRLRYGPLWSLQRNRMVVLVAWDCWVNGGGSLREAVKAGPWPLAACLPLALRPAPGRRVRFRDGGMVVRVARKAVTFTDPRSNGEPRSKMAKRPSVKTKCVAQHFAAQNERIIEFSSPQGGGLISFRAMENGELWVSLYQLDADVKVFPPSHKGER